RVDGPALLRQLSAVNAADRPHEDAMVGRGHDDVTRFGFPHDASSEVDGNAADVIASLLDFTDVNASASLQTEIARDVPESDRRGDRFGTGREGCERAVYLLAIIGRVRTDLVRASTS
ncbi:MAG: hypothetical protein MUQ27_08355, partial [Acidimicrobiia bacterium]|nr:hypothetical protein [Acidimicrobiia bacterium]